MLLKSLTNMLKVFPNKHKFSRIPVYINFFSSKNKCQEGNEKKFLRFAHSTTIIGNSLLRAYSSNALLQFFFELNTNIL